MAFFRTVRPTPLVLSSPAEEEINLRVSRRSEESKGFAAAGGVTMTIEGRFHLFAHIAIHTQRYIDLSENAFGL
jgi:hypothetical protein